jgi:hypothetical protein
MENLILPGWMTGHTSLFMRLWYAIVGIQPKSDIIYQGPLNRLPEGEMRESPGSGPSRFYSHVANLALIVYTWPGLHDVEEGR